MRPIATAADLEEARSQPRALVFLWVNWAIQAYKSRHMVRELVSSWEAAHPDLMTPIYTADLSDQQGEVWDAIRSWLEKEGRPGDQLTFGGCGPLLWLRSGSVIAHVLFAGYYELSKLLAVTRGVYESEQ